MVSVSTLLLGLAVLCCPASRSAGRLRRLLSRRDHVRDRLRLPRPTTFVVALGFGVAGYVLGGLGGGLAAGLAAATAWRRLATRRSLRTTLATVDGLAEALRSMVAELRAGAHPARAAEAAALDAQPAAGRAMRAIAAAARLDGDVHRALAASRAATPCAMRALDQLSRAWILAQRHGLPLADVLDAVRGDLETRVRFARQVLARMAGPRASATILVLLPALGLALGEAMGARPLQVLTGTTTGQFLLVLGVGLACAGVFWSARLTTQVLLVSGRPGANPEVPVSGRETHQRPNRSQQEST